ncbi:MAG: outer membrane beta-barrel protein [Bacteroidota bacterium]
MQKIFYLIILLVSVNALAQEYQVKGKLIDEVTDQPLESATIFSETISDSTLVDYTISNSKGEFSLEGKSSEEKLRVIVSYTGLENQSFKVTLAEKTIDLGEIIMKTSENSLEEVVVKSVRSPIVLKKDTLEFNAKSFQTRENANLEDVLKQLPGVEVSNSGEIKVNGQDVSRILVNGKEFFGDDPKIATKNLPKEIIDKIQVVDTKTREEEFTGKAGDSENKTINIELEEDKDKGYFSRLTAGGGTDGRYEGSGIGNYFEGEERISVLAGANNINSPGFSYDEVFDMMGSSARGGLNMRGGGNGITTSQSAGTNYVNDWEDEKYDLAADYFYGGTQTRNEVSSIRENILPEGSYFSNSEQSSRVDNHNHRSSVRFDIMIDSMTRISFRPNISADFGTSESSSLSTSTTEDGDLINTAETNSREDNQSTNFSNNFTFSRKFGEKGSYVSLRFRNSHRNRENDNYFFSERTTAEQPDSEIQDQLIATDNSTDEYNTSFTYRQALAEKLFLDASYSFEVDKTTNSRSVLDFDEASNSYSDLNQNLSNAFNYTGQIHRPSLGLRLETEKIRSGLSLGLLNSQLSTSSVTTDSEFDNSFNNLLANAFVNYQFSRSKSIRFSYRNDAQIPSAIQLQPVEIVTDPLNITVGNQNLNPAFSQSVRLRYNSFDYKNRTGFSAFASFTNTDNQVVPVITTDNDLVRTRTYTNVDGVQQGNAFLFYSKQIQTEGTDVMRYVISTSGSYSKNIGFTNEVEFNSDIYGVSPSLMFVFERPDMFNIRPRIRLNYNSTRYDIFSNRNENFTNTEFTLESTLLWPENFIFGNDISYFNYGNVSDAYENTSLLWNVSVGYQFWDDDATIKLKIFDLLNQNIATRRTTGEDFIQDTNQLILRRYAMLSFTYKFSKFGGKDPNESGRGRRGRRR